MADHFIPWQVDYDTETELIRRYRIHMVPTLIFTDEKGREHYRSVGYLPPKLFLSQLAMGGAKVAFGKHRHEEASELFDEVAEVFPDCSVSPEAIYYRGVSRDKLTENHTNRKMSAKELEARCPGSEVVGQGERLARGMTFAGEYSLERSKAATYVTREDTPIRYVHQRG